MQKFPADAPKSRIIKTLKRLGFQLVREREHIAMIRINADGTKTPLTMPNHLHIKGATLRTICKQANITRD
jgi:predicted RNA binding protein YcfA (HicA-like mRNA interferase family)